MPTTADYLNNLLAQRDNLADNLVAKGVSASKTELLDTLVPKVLQIEESSGSNGLNIYTQMNEPATKEGIWLQTNNTYDKIVVDSSTYLSGSKLLPGEDGFPNYSDPSGYVTKTVYYEPTDCLYSIGSSVSYIKVNKLDLKTNIKTTVFEFKDTTFETHEKLGLILSGDCIYIISEYSYNSYIHHYLRRYNISSNTLTNLFASTSNAMPYYITTYGYFRRTAGGTISPLVEHNGLLYFIGGITKFTGSNQKVYLCSYNTLTGVFSQIREVGNHNTSNSILSSAQKNRCTILGIVGKYIIIQHIWGYYTDSTTKDLYRDIYLYDIDINSMSLYRSSLMYSEVTAIGKTVENLDLNTDMSRCFVADNKMHLLLGFDFNKIDNIYQSLVLDVNTGVISTLPLADNMAYHADINSFTSTATCAVYIPTLHQLWCIRSNSSSSSAIVYAYSVISKQYEDGDLVLIRTSDINGKYYTVLAEIQKELTAKDLTPFTRLCTGFDNAYLFKDGDLKAPPAYYGDGTQWIKIR